MRARVVLWSNGTAGLASMKHFASSPWDIDAAYFSNFELVFVSRNPPDSSKENCYGDLVTEIL